jgi:hypothetical protein
MFSSVLGILSGKERYIPKICPRLNRPKLDGGFYCFTWYNHSQVSSQRQNDDRIDDCVVRPVGISLKVIGQVEKSGCEARGICDPRWAD